MPEEEQPVRMTLAEWQKQSDQKQSKQLIEQEKEKIKVEEQQLMMEKEELAEAKDRMEADMDEYIGELEKCGWDSTHFDKVTNKSKYDILEMALMTIEAIIRPLQRKFPEIFKDIMAVYAFIWLKWLYRKCYIFLYSFFFFELK